MPQIAAEYSVESFFPVSPDGFGGDHILYVGGEFPVEVFVVVAGFPFGKSRISLLGHNAVPADDIQHVGTFPARGKGRVAVQAHVFLGFFLIGTVYDVHLGQVDRLFTHADHFGLHKGYPGVIPAGARGCLVLYRSGRIVLYDREMEFFLPLSLLGTIRQLSGHQKRQDQDSGQQGEQIIFIHSGSF